MSAIAIRRPIEPPSDAEISRVAEWFRIATTGQHVPRKARIPSRQELVPIAVEVGRLKRRWQLLKRRDEMSPSEAMGAGIARKLARVTETRRALAHPFRELKTALDSAAREGLPEELLDLIDAMKAAEPQIDAWAPALGRRPGEKHWNRAAAALREPVARALLGVGRQASNGRTSPLVKVIGAALVEIYDEMYGAEAISSCLDRAPSWARKKKHFA